MTTLPYQDQSLSTDERVEDLLGRLTLEEKAGQLSQYFYFGSFGDTAEGSEMGATPAEAADTALQSQGVEAALAHGGVGSLLFVRDATNANRLQRLAIEGHRLGIPALFGFDVIHGFRTILPAPIALAASWHPETIEQGQAVAAREARAVGIHWTFAPMVDITRDPRWGRIIEGAGEDPVLGAAVAAAQVRGFQGELGSENVLSGPKHFAGYGASVGGRDYEESDISDSELWNIYFPPFKGGIDAGARNIMGAYMDLNGVPASGNKWLLTEVLRDALGFDGFVVSDANAVRSLEVQHFARDLTEAGVRALNAGLDMEMCMADPAYSRLPQAVAEGRVDEASIDQAVRRVLRAKFEIGLFENPYVDEDATAEILGREDHREISRAAAEKTFVLLKNDADALPLDTSALRSIAVIGDLADSQRDVLGPWVFDHDATEAVTILEGIRRRAEGVEVTYASGASVPNRLYASMFDRMDAHALNTAADYDDESEIERAIEVARAADVAVVVVGQRQNQIGESASTATLDLPGRQLEQLQRIVETGTRVVVLVMSGRPLDIQWVHEHVPAILQVWYPGTRGGDAVAAALFGDVSPAGRLPFTWPRHVGHVPTYYNHYRSFQPENQTKRYWGQESTALYPFGHGLSYASFTYDNLTLDREQIGVGETATVSVDVTNTSDRDADDVVQLYIHQRYGTSTRPVRELKGFERVTVPAGQTVTVTFQLGPDQLRYWSGVTRDWVQDQTVIDVWAGGSSEAELTTTLTVG